MTLSKHWTNQHIMCYLSTKVNAHWLSIYYVGHNLFQSHVDEFYYAFVNDITTRDRSKLICLLWLWNFGEEYHISCIHLGYSFYNLKKLQDALQTRGPTQLALKNWYQNQDGEQKLLYFISFNGPTHIELLLETPNMTCLKNLLLTLNSNNILPS